MLSAQRFKRMPLFFISRGPVGKPQWVVVALHHKCSCQWLQKDSEGLANSVSPFCPPWAVEWWRIKDLPTGAWLPFSRHLLYSCKHPFAFCPIKQGLSTAIAGCTGVKSASMNLSPSPKRQHWESDLIWRQGFQVFSVSRLRILKWCHLGIMWVWVKWCLWVRRPGGIKNRHRKMKAGIGATKPQANDITDCQKMPDNSSLNQVLPQIFFPSNLADTLILNLLALELWE